MAELNDDDRRRSPRFICSGEARISRLPSDGALVSGRLRNLSMGGICIETNLPVDLGERHEILINVDAVSFRTLGLVRAIRERTRASLEFVQMSAGSRDILAEVLEHMARLQKVMRKIRSVPVKTKAELSRELEEVGVHTQLVNRVSSLGKIPVDEGLEMDSTPRAGSETNVELLPLVIRVDLFG
jgi:hypothetical protein